MKKAKYDAGQSGGGKDFSSLLSAFNSGGDEKKPEEPPFVPQDTAEPLPVLVPPFFVTNAYNSIIDRHNMIVNRIKKQNKEK